MKILDVGRVQVKPRFRPGLANRLFNVMRIVVRLRIIVSFHYLDFQVLRGSKLDDP